MSHTHAKEYIKAVYYYPAYLTYMQSISCEMLGWMKQKKVKDLMEGHFHIPTASLPNLVEPQSGHLLFDLRIL